MRKDSTNIIPACLVDSVHDAIAPLIDCYDACNFIMEIELRMADCDDRSSVNYEIQAFENDTFDNSDRNAIVIRCVYRFNIIQHPAIAIHSFVRNQ